MKKIEIGNIEIEACENGIVSVFTDLGMDAKSDVRYIDEVIVAGQQTTFHTMLKRQIFN